MALQRACTYEPVSGAVAIMAWVSGAGMHRWIADANAATLEFYVKQGKRTLPGTAPEA